MDITVSAAAITQPVMTAKPQQSINIKEEAIVSQQQQQQPKPTTAATATASLLPGQLPVELTEHQKKLLGMTSADDPFASLEQQVDVTLKGKEQRLLLMQKLMQRKPESKVMVLRNMVGPDDIDEYLEGEITGL